MKSIKRIMVLVLVCTLLFTLTGCGSGTTWVYKTGEHSMLAGQYVSYQINALNEFMSEVKIPEDVKPSSFVEALDHKIDGVIGHDWVSEKTTTMARSAFAVKQEFARLGLSTSADDDIALQNQVSNTWKEEKVFYESSGVSYASYLEYTHDLNRRDKLFSALYEEGGEQEVPTAEIIEIFVRDYAKADVVQMKLFPEGEEEVLGAFEKAAREQAEAYLVRLKAGESAEAILLEYLISQATDEEKESITMPEEGSLAHVISESTKYMYEYYGMTELAEFVLEHKNAEPLIVEGKNALFLLVPRSLEDDSESLTYYRSTILFELKEDDFKAHLTQLSTTLNIEENAASLKLYQPKDIAQPKPNLYGEYSR